MSNHDSDLLAIVSKQCFFRYQPQPLVDLLNKRGIVGRHAEVFWTYFHWGFQNGSFKCQLSSAYVAELLFTDIRTVQRANERLQDAGFITRARAKKTRGTHLEAPAITTITLPDEEARLMLVEAPQRGVRQAEVKSTAPTKEFTGVNPAPAARSDEAQTKPPSPAPAALNCPPANEGQKATRDLTEIKADLPEKARRFHDVCMVKASPGAFRRVLDEMGNVSDVDAEALMKPLREALELKRREVSEAQKRSPVTEPTTPVEATAARAGKRPEDPRSIPETAVSLINQRLQATDPDKTRAGRSVSDLAREVIYSITIGTMRGVDMMHAINATIKLIATKKWSRPRGMPEGWRFDHVVMGAA